MFCPQRMEWIACDRQIVTGFGFVVILNEALLVHRTLPRLATDHDQTHNVGKNRELSLTKLQLKG